MIEKLHDAGLRSEHAYVAGFAGIGTRLARKLRAAPGHTSRTGARPSVGRPVHCPGPPTDTQPSPSFCNMQRLTLI